MLSKFTSKAQDRARGFTLIEVLVVVSIIALLISILLPSLASAREQARTAVCLSRFHTLGIAVQTFVAEHKGYYPDAGLWFDKFGTTGKPGRFGYALDYRTPKEGGYYDAPFGPNMRGDLAKYMGSSPEAFMCPADDGYRWWKDYTAAGLEFVALPPRLSYVMNGDLDGLTKSRKISGTEVNYSDSIFMQPPSLVMMMFEESPLTCMNDSWGEWRGYDGAENNARIRRPWGAGFLASRHNQRQAKADASDQGLKNAMKDGLQRAGALLFYDTHAETLIAGKFNGVIGDGENPRNVPAHIRSGLLFDGVYQDSAGKYRIRTAYRPTSKDLVYKGT